MKERDILQQVNETPVTYAVLLAYVTMAYLTRSFTFQPDLDALIDFGAAVGYRIVDDQPWRILTHAFLHGGLIHLLLNSYALVILGPPLEYHLGWWRFSILYAVTAATGCITALMVNPEFVPLVGGSGALFGMLGALLALNVRGGRTLLDFLENHGARQLIGLIVINLLIGWFIPVVSNSAHVGGLIGGFVIVFCFFDIGRRNAVDFTGRVLQAGWVAVLVALLAYQVRPVLRFDYTLRQYLRTTGPERRAQLRVILEEHDDVFGATVDEVRGLLQKESEPQTGIPGVAIREAGLGRSFQKTIRRWKHR